jgi:hypothetical protein
VEASPLSAVAESAGWGIAVAASLGAGAGVAAGFVSGYLLS